MEDVNTKMEYSQFDATHAEIAKEMGKSRSYVSLIEKEALEKLRKKLLWKHNIASMEDLLWFTETGNYLTYLDNPHARSVVERTAQLWLPIQISFGMVKAEELKPTTIVLRPCALAAMRNSTKAQNSQNPKGLRCGMKHTEKQSAGYLKTGI